MARGESEASGSRGTGVAIWAIFGVACLFTAFLVIRATGEPDVEPYELEQREPFPGAEGTARVLGWRGCTGAQGPAVPGPSGGARGRIERDLEMRGYEAAGDWSDPVALPIEQSFPDLIGKCGVVAVITDGGGAWLTHTGDDQVCTHDATTAGACGTETVRIAGSGNVRLRIYTMDGLSDGDPERTGIPSDALLAHAEAEVLLGRGAWSASVSVVEEPLARTTSGSHTLRPPARPGSGCVPFVAVGLGVDSARTNWLGRNVSWSNTQGRFVVAAIACAGSGMFGDRMTELAVTDTGSGGTIWWRAYDASSAGPSTTTVTPTIGAATLTSAAGVALPPSVDDVIDR